jgi:hypothetical protein
MIYDLSSRISFLNSKYRRSAQVVNKVSGPLAIKHVLRNESRCNYFRRVSIRLLTTFPAVALVTTEVILDWQPSIRVLLTAMACYS